MENQFSAQNSWMVHEPQPTLKILLQEGPEKTSLQLIHSTATRAPGILMRWNKRNQREITFAFQRAQRALEEKDHHSAAFVLRGKQVTFNTSPNPDPKEPKAKSASRLRFFQGICGVRRTEIATLQKTLAELPNPQETKPEPTKPSAKPIPGDREEPEENKQDPFFWPMEEREHFQITQTNPQKNPAALELLRARLPESHLHLLSKEFLPRIATSRRGWVLAATHPTLPNGGIHDNSPSGMFALRILRRPHAH